MSLRTSFLRGQFRRTAALANQRRRVLAERLESRNLLAGDFVSVGGGFVDSLPTADQVSIGETLVNEEGREICLAFRSMKAGEGEAVDSGSGDGFSTMSSGLASSSTGIDIAASIANQPAGPLAPGAAFTTEVTFENLGDEFAPGTQLEVDFDANLDGITWQRVITRPQPAVVDGPSLGGFDGFRINGVAAFDAAGTSVGGTGDFNGDALEDVLIGAPGANAAYVVYGTDAGFPADLDLSALDGANGFVIQGSSDGTGDAVANAGDISGDGIDDIVIGSPGANAGSGSVSVVLGSASRTAASVDLASLAAADGFSIAGEEAGDALGSAVSSAGDINNDGIDDLLISAPERTIPQAGSTTGQTDTVGIAYVVFGQSTSFGTSFDLATLDGTNGFQVTTANVGDRLGSSLTGDFDLNGDSISDLAIGATQDPTEGDGSGEVFVVFGRDSQADPPVTFAVAIDVANLDGSTGFKVESARADHLFGTDVSGLSDINGDAIDDLIISESSNSDTTASPRSYVLFGSGSGFAAVVDGENIGGSTGFVIDAPSSSNVNPMAVSNAGDVNGDGLGDLIVGIPESEELVDGVATAIPGGAYVVFGNPLGFTSPFDLSSLDGSNGFEIQGEDAIEQAGFDVSAAGDVNNDGFDDVVVGGNFGNGFAGRAYVVLGRGTTTTLGTGSIDETLDLGPGDQVVYSVSATIAASATVETVVNATSTVATGLTDTDTANDTASATTTIASGDTTSPTVVDVIAAGLNGPFAWTSEFIDAVDDTGGSGANNGLGYSLLSGDDPLPWYTVDTFYIRFSEPVNAPTAVSFFGETVADYAGDFTIAHSGDLTTVSMTSPFGAAESDPGAPTSGIDRLIIGLAAGSVSDLAGNVLAADFSEPFAVLPGNVNLNNDVSVSDVLQINARVGADTTGATSSFGFAYDIFFDVSGNGAISVQDVLITNIQVNDELPASSSTSSSTSGASSVISSNGLTAEEVDDVFDGRLF